MRLLRNLIVGNHLMYLENEAKEAEYVEQITTFLSEYVEIYEELTEMKIARDKSRTGQLSVPIQSIQKRLTVT